MNDKEIKEIKEMLTQIMQHMVRMETRLCKLAVALGQEKVLGK